MDFSKYATPSKQWLAFKDAYPSEARLGFDNNTLEAASILQQEINASREAQLRQHYAQTGIEAQVDVTTIHVPTRDGSTIPLRRTVPRGYNRKRPLRAMLFFHGGGMLFGTETSDDHTCAEFAAALDIAVLNVVYRHTPEYTFPTQHHDGLDAFEYVRTHAAELGIDLEAGISMVCNSAGALPASAVVLHDLARAREEGRRTYFSGVVLTMPWLIHADNFPVSEFASPEKTSRGQCPNSAILPSDRLKLFSDLIGSPSCDDPLMNPALVPDEALEGWPKTGFVVAGHDMLRDDALYFAKRLEKLDVLTSVHIFPGLPHGFRKWTTMPAAVAFDDRTIDCIRWSLHLNGHRMLGWHEYQEGCP